jgi:hypothetical protein
LAAAPQPDSTPTRLNTKDMHMHTGYHRRRAWEARVMLLLATLPLFLAAAWLTMHAAGFGTALLVLASLAALQLCGGWLLWQSKP